MEFIVTDGYPRFNKIVRYIVLFIVLTTVFVFYQVSDGFQSQTPHVAPSSRAEDASESEFEGESRRVEDTSSYDEMATAVPLDSTSIPWITESGEQSLDPADTVVEDGDSELSQDTYDEDDSGVAETVAENVDSAVLGELVEEAINEASSSSPETESCAAVEMNSILERLSEFCGGVKRFKNNWFELLTMYNINPKRLVYDLDRDYVWMTVPKIASSNWKRLILTEKLSDPALLQEGLEKPHVFLEECCELTEEVAQREPTLQRAFTFSFIRNPWSRLYSAFNDKIIKWKAFNDYEYIAATLRTARGWTAEQVLNKAEVVDAADSITFTEFLTMLALSDTDTYNVHWTPWFHLTEACQVKYDYIGYMEDMETAFSLIKGNLFNDTQLSLPPAYNTQAKSEEVKEAYRTVPSSILNLVYAKFQDDFVIGGYSRQIECIS